MTGIGDDDLFGNLRQCFEAVQHEEAALLNAASRVNYRYHELGTVYVQIASRYEECREQLLTSKAFHRHAFPKVSQAYIERFGEAIPLKLRKRLERARKFYLLVDLFSPTVLQHAKLINVSWIDRISFRMFEELKKSI